MVTIVVTIWVSVEQVCRQLAVLTRRMTSLASRILRAFERRKEYDYACIRGVFKTIRPSEKDKAIVVEPEDVVFHDIFDLFDGELCETPLRCCVRFLEDGEMPRDLLTHIQREIIEKGKCVVFLDTRTRRPSTQTNHRMCTSSLTLWGRTI